MRISCVCHPATKSNPATAKAGNTKPNHQTWEYPQGSGIKIAEIPNRTGGAVFGVSYHIRIPGELLGQPGRREMLQRKTKAAAEKLAEDRFIALKKHGTEFVKITATAQKQAAIAWSILNEHNESAALALSLIDVVKAGIRVLSPAGGRKTVAEVFAELRASKAERCASGGLDSSTLHDFTIRSGRTESELGASFRRSLAR